MLIKYICCSHSDANGVCQQRHCVSDKLGTLFACEENACLWLEWHAAPTDSRGFVFLIDPCHA